MSIFKKGRSVDTSHNVLRLKAARRVSLLLGITLRRNGSVTDITSVQETLPATSSTFVSSPVELPVNIIPSARKNSAAFAVSSRLTSEVMACELYTVKYREEAMKNGIYFCRETFPQHIKLKLVAHSYLCFFLMSAKMRTWSASICLLYLSKVPALASMKPSSAM